MAIVKIYLNLGAFGAICPCYATSSAEIYDELYVDVPLESYENDDGEPIDEVEGEAYTLNELLCVGRNGVPALYNFETGLKTPLRIVDVE